MPKLCNGALLYISDWVKSLCSRDSGRMFVDCFCNSINVRSDSRPVWIWWLGGIILIYLASVFVNNPVSDPRTQLCQCLNLNVWFNWIYSYSKIIEYSPITKWNMYSRNKEYQRVLIETYKMCQFRREKRGGLRILIILICDIHDQDHH